MSEVSLIQKLAVLSAILILAFIAVAPFYTTLISTSQGHALLNERRAAIAMLTARIDEDRQMMQQNPRAFASSLNTLDADSVTENLRGQCEMVLEFFADLTITTPCALSQSVLDGALQYHSATLTVSGDVEPLLKTLDAVSAANAFRLDRMHLSTTPGEREATTKLELRFSDVSDMPEAQTP